MKKIMIIAASMLVACAAFAQDGKSIYNKYSGNNGVEAVYISPSMFKMIGELPELTIDAAGDEMDISPVVRSLNGMYILDSSNSKVNESLTSDVLKFAEKEKFELLMEASDEGELVRMYTSADKKDGDFINGFQDGNTIDNSIESINTNTLYTHYTLQIPNERCSLKMSGNYKLTVFDENDDNRPVFTACFMVVEPLMGVQLDVTTNTDIDINKSHQQVSMAINYGTLNVIDPNSQIKTVVMQNQRWDNAKINAKPQYIVADGLKWEHNRDLIFQAGNEYRKYEILDVSHPTMGIDRIVWDGNNYQVYPFPCDPRPNYVYDEDANGCFYIRNSDNVENDIASEYVYVNYILNVPQKLDGDIYLNGVWTNDQFTPEYKMTYDEANGCYTASVFQKQGYYSYQFVLIDKQGVSRVVPSEGNFFQTENKYQALVYYRGQGDRTDRLVGYQQVQIK